MGKRFDLSMLLRFERQGRGIGIFEDYIAWHRVSRSDPSSRGRSHLQKWRERQRELLSDLELVAFFFCSMHPELIDVREQFPLSATRASHELNEYRAGYAHSDCPGTVELAEQLETKHPTVYGATGQRAVWIMTTDLLLTLKNSAGELRLLAISVKPKSPPEGSRSKQLLNLECEYWAKRGVPWLLITPKEYDPLVSDTLKGTSCWAWGLDCDLALLGWLIDRQHDFHGQNLTYILRYAASQGKDREATKVALWRGIWTGKLSFDLHRGWRPSEPFRLISVEEFWARNPVVSGRSAWIA